MRIDSTRPSYCNQRGQRKMRFLAVAVLAACALPLGTSAHSLDRRRDLTQEESQQNNDNSKTNGQGKWQWKNQNKNENDSSGNQWKSISQNKWNNGNGNKWQQQNKNKQGKSDNYDWKADSASTNDQVQPEETQSVDAFLLNNETEWHEIPYDDDTVSGWQEMQAATAVPTVSPTPKWKSDEPSSLPTRVPTWTKPTWTKPVTKQWTWKPKEDKTDSPTPEPTKQPPKTDKPTKAPTTNKPTDKPTRSPAAVSGGNGGNKFLSFPDNGWRQNSDSNSNSGISISTSGQSPNQFISVGSPPTSPPTEAPVTVPTDDGGASFFNFLTPTFSEEGGTEQVEGSTAPEATVATAAPGDWSALSSDPPVEGTKAPVVDSTQNSTSFFQIESVTEESNSSNVSVATAPPTYPSYTGYTEQGYAPPVDNGVNMDAYPPSKVGDVTHLFDASQLHNQGQAPEAVAYPAYPEAYPSEVEMQNMTNADTINGTDYGYEEEGGEDYAGQPYYASGSDNSTNTTMNGSGQYYPDPYSSVDIPSWNPYPEGGSRSTPPGSSKRGKGGKGKGGGSGSRGASYGTSSDYEAAIKCIEEQKTAKKGGKDDKMKKCPDIGSSKGGARKKIKAPKPEYPSHSYPLYPPSPTFFRPTVTYPPIPQMPVSSQPHAAMAPSIAPVGFPTVSIGSPGPTALPGTASPGASEPPTAAGTSSPVAGVPTPDLGTRPPSVGTLSPTSVSQPSVTSVPGVSGIPTSPPNAAVAVPSVGPPTVSMPTVGTAVPSATSGTSIPSVAVPTASGGLDTFGPSLSGNSDSTAIPTALMQTAPPNSSTTSAPTQPLSISEASETWVAAKNVTVEAVGSIDLSTAQGEVFNQTVSVMKPFFETYFGENLKSFQLGLTFLESKTASVPVGDAGSEAQVTSYFVAQVSFLISSADMDVLIEFTQEKATEVVQTFFQGESRDVLLKLLYGQGIELDSLEVFSGELPIDDDATDDQPDGGGASNPTLSPTKDPELAAEASAAPQSADSKSTNAALYAGIVSGGVILVAIGAVIYSTRNSDRNFFKDALESVSDSLYNDSLAGPPGGKVLPVLSPRANATARTGKSSMASSDSRSRIKPAAITLRKKKAAQQSSDSVSTLGTTRFPTDGRSPTINEDRAEDYDHLHRMENGPDLVASRVLTYHDADIQGLVTNYPEFDIYHQNPYADTAWSVDGLTLEDESLVDRPRRWQDESSETGISGLPDHHSSSNGSARS